MDKDKLKLMFECIALAVLINEHTDYCVFIDFSGHIDTLDVSIRKNKDQYQIRLCETEMKTAYLSWYHEDKSDVNAWLKAKRDVLKQILDENDIPYDTMDEQIETLVTYIF